MADEENKDPTWKPGDLEANSPIKIVLDSPKHVAEGTNNWGMWHLWPVVVTNVKVHKREGKKEIPNFSGKAICFPSPKLHERFLKHTNGTKEGVEIEVTMIPKKNSKGNWYTTYETKVLSEGKTPSNNILDSHYNFINDFKSFVKSKVVIGTKDDFINFSKTNTYNLTEEVAEKLWVIYNEQREKQ